MGDSKGTPNATDPEIDCSWAEPFELLRPESELGARLRPENEALPHPPEFESRNDAPELRLRLFCIVLFCSTSVIPAYLRCISILGK